MEEWSKGNLLEKRAAIAALCEPRLLTSNKVVGSVLNILDLVTTSFASLQNRSSEDFEVLKKGLAYCWSVAVVAYPEKGKKLIEKWVKTRDKDIIWVMKQNLKKNRLLKMDNDWVSSQLKLLLWKEKVVPGTGFEPATSGCRRLPLANSRFLIWLVFSPRLWVWRPSQARLPRHIASRFLRRCHFSLFSFI